MGAFGKVRDWIKYERLNHYPALAAFDREEALKRLVAYDREEREASRTWLLVSFTVVILLFVVWILMVRAYPLAASLLLFAQIPGWAMQYMLHRRIRKRVEARVAAELRDGRLWKCIECDYDLRESPDRCPECGAAVQTPSRAPERL